MSANNRTTNARSAGIRRPATFLTLTPVLSIRPAPPPSRFLSLAPVQSRSYPSPPAHQPSSVQGVPDHLLWIAPTPQVSPVTFRPRADSVSSISSIGSTDSLASVESEVEIRKRSGSVTSFRGNSQVFLKLGPVHWGGMPGVEDWVLDQE